MKLPLLTFTLLVSGIFSNVCFARPFAAGDPASPAATNLTMFGRDTYPGEDSTYEHLKQSGFTTVILSSFYIRSNGDLYSGDDSKNPIIHDGKYVGDPEWLKRVASLKQGKTSITRIEILFEGRWYNQPPNTYDYIRTWANDSTAPAGVVTGTGANSTLYKICKVLKDAVGVDAICIDDESVYDAISIIRLGSMIGKLNMHMTLCPYTKFSYWKGILDGSKKGLIDAIYVQCYDGGARNTPGPWKTHLATNVPIYPIFLCRGAFSTCATDHNSKSPDEIKAEMIRFKKEYPGMTGAGIWQMADVNKYVKMDCATQMPESGKATTVTDFLADLKKSLTEGL